MSLCYMFCRGKIIFYRHSGAEEMRIPFVGEELSVESQIVNSGSVDRAAECGDRWVQLSDDAVLPEQFAAGERRTAWTVVGEEQFFRMGKAFHLMEWQRTHKFCGVCGNETQFDAYEFAMRCTKCGSLHYPVICPAMIVCVEKDGKILLGHNASFPNGRYSVLAGFAEPGESLEECVSREVYEEAHIRVKNIRYFASQPWAFPSSMMIGFTAEWESGDICPDRSELTDIRWFAPNEIPEYYKGVSISARLIEDFVKRHGGRG
ncbi:MAG: NAD(+) diphosphatase [Synergistes sp.]|nr:NAD(+) diphosphatase [Synergistes sp.]